MIPIYLKMEGFLTFKKPTHINFEDFVEEGIFLVSGPTGSGKTSIFDAISFALYGKATGGGREARELRSQLIDDEDDFSVEFKFRSGEHEYVVSRWQKGQRVGKVRLVIDEDEENPITKVGQINDKIFEVLGLNADQFCKIVMLPQGEFRNFLSSSSKEKSEILRKLFDTDHYAQIRENIRRRLAQISNQVKLEKNLIESEKTISQKARLAEDPDEILEILTEEWKSAEKESKSFKMQMELLRTQSNHLEFQFNEGKQTNHDLDEEAALAEKIKQAEKEEDHFRENLKRSLALNSIRPLKVHRDGLLTNQMNQEKLQTKYTALSLDLKESGEKLMLAAREYEQNSDRQSRLTDISAEITGLNTSLLDLETLKKVQLQARQAEDKATQLSAKVAEHKNWIQRKEELAMRHESLTQDELNKNQAVTDLKTQISELKEIHQQARTWQRLHADLSTREDELKRCGEQILDLREKSEEARNRYELLRTDLAKQGLGQYAHSLIDGQPCPLCGGLEHPLPFKGNPDLDQATVASAEKINRKLENDLAVETNNQDHLKKQIEINRLEIKSLETECDGANLQADIDELETRLHDLEEKGKEETAQLKELQNQKGELQLARKTAEQQVHNLAKAADEHNDARDELTGLKVRLEDLKEKTKDMDEEELTGALLARRSESTTLADAIKNAQKSYQAADQQVTSLTSTLESLTGQIQELTEEIHRQEIRLKADLAQLDLSLEEFLGLEKDLDLERKLKEEAEAFFHELQANRTRHEMMISKLKGKDRIDLVTLQLQIDELKTQEKAVAQASEQCIRLETGLRNAVAKTSKALTKYKEWEEKRIVASRLDQTTGKGTTFENYVLGYYLEGVLMNANVRLKKMTSDRFHLIRQAEDSGDKRAIEGLNLNVFDAYSNSQRDVKTLSGGEGFKASLALALGLSDFIQENKSGIRLDTIFIDEGFGTLDHESLDTAMETIMELQGLGRLVGIISHVEELKERIPTQIVVENRREEGSVLKIVKH